MSYFTVILIIYCLTPMLAINGLDVLEIHNLTDNMVFELRNEAKSERLDIYCSCGQQVLPLNALMSSHFCLIEPPIDYRLLTANHFNAFNESEIIKHFKKRWSQERHWSLKSTLPTSLQIPSFTFHCIAIVSNNSYKCQLIVKNLDTNRLVLLIIGFILFTFGPKISRSITFYYTSCTALGVFASFLIIFFIINRYFPRKVSAIILMFGSTGIVFAFQTFSETLKHFIINHSFYVIIYTFLSAFISFCLSYRFGPITHPKTLDLIQWSLQLIGLTFVAISSQLYEYSLALILFLIVLKVFPFKQFFTFKRKQKIVIKLLTETEFELQSDVQTRKSLDELRAYCQSSDCNAWKVMCRLKDPIRFAQFICGEHHISDQEICFYESIQSNGLIALNINETIDEDNSEDDYQDLH